MRLHSPRDDEEFLFLRFVFGSVFGRRDAINSLKGAREVRLGSVADDLAKLVERHLAVDEDIAGVVELDLLKVFPYGDAHVFPEETGKMRL